MLVPIIVFGFFVFAPAASAWMNDLCISFGGHHIYQSGSTACSTSPGHNLAVVVGPGAAVAGTGAAAVTWDGSSSSAGATASGGSRNTAIALFGSAAAAGGGDGNTVIAKFGSAAAAGSGGAAANSPDWAAFVQVVGGGGGNLVIAEHQSAAGVSGQLVDLCTGPETTCGAASLSCASSAASSGSVEGETECGTEVNPANDNTVIAKGGSGASAVGDGNHLAAIDEGFAAVIGDWNHLAAIDEGFAAVIGDWNHLAAIDEGSASAIGDWNDILAKGCVLVLEGSNQSDICGPHHNNTPEP